MKRTLWLTLIILGVGQHCDLLCYRGCVAMNPTGDCAAICRCSQAEVPSAPAAPSHPASDSDEDSLSSTGPRALHEAHSDPRSDYDDQDDQDETRHTPARSTVRTPPRTHTHSVNTLTIIDRCQEKCADMCPDGGECMTACYTHFCGVEEEGSQQRRVLLLCAIVATALFAFWLVSRLRRKPSVARVDRQPFIAFRAVPSE